VSQMVLDTTSIIPMSEMVLLTVFILKSHCYAKKL